MELKNVKEVKQEHILQLNRYLKEQFGNFGIIISRNPVPKKVFRNICYVSIYIWKWKHII
jgi:hypothetical protein